MWRQPGTNTTTGKTQVGEPQRQPSKIAPCGARWPDTWFSTTYCGVGVRAEHSVLPDDAVQLERGEPGHEDHGGRGRSCLHARGRTWNWKRPRLSHMMEPHGVQALPLQDPLQLGLPLLLSPEDGVRVLRDHRTH